MNKLYVFLTNPRCGTVFLYDVLNQLADGQFTCMHEPLSRRDARFRWLHRCYSEDIVSVANLDPLLSSFIDQIKFYLNKRSVVLLGNTTSHLAPLFYYNFPNQTHFVHLHRNIMINIGSLYSKIDPRWWNITHEFKFGYYDNILVPEDPRIYHKRFIGMWPRMSHFERVAFFLIERTWSHLEIIKRFNVKSVAIKSEEIFSHQVGLRTFAEFLELDAPLSEPIEELKNETWARAVEEKPLPLDQLATVVEWPEIKNFAGLLNYDLDVSRLEITLSRYCLPDKIGSRLRHMTGYWLWRRRLALMLRKYKLLPEQVIALGKNPEQSSEI